MILSRSIVRLLSMGVVLLLPLPLHAFDITYDGAFIVDGKAPVAVTQNAIPVTRYVSVVTTVSPVTDASDNEGGRHCWYMIDKERGLKAMIASQPIETVGPQPFGANRPAPSNEEMGAIAEFVRSVYREAEDSGGVKKLAERCAKTAS